MRFFSRPPQKIINIESRVVFAYRMPSHPTHRKSVNATICIPLYIQQFVQTTDSGGTSHSLTYSFGTRTTGTAATLDGRRGRTERLRFIAQACAVLPASLTHFSRVENLDENTARAHLSSHCSLTSSLGISLHLYNGATLETEKATRQR